MLDVNQLNNAVSDVANDLLSMQEFERWLRGASRNVHEWGDEDLNNAVLSLESVLSDYHFEDLAEEVAKKELANAIRPFVPPRYYGYTHRFDLRKPPRGETVSRLIEIALSV